MRSFLPSGVGKPLLTLLCFFFFTQAFSQHLIIGGKVVKAEAGINFGPTFFLGDLGGNAGKGSRFLKDLNFPLTKFMKGAFISLYPREWIGLRAAGQLTYVEGDDAIISTKGVHESWRKQRNLDFRSSMWEAYMAIELYPTMIFKKYDDYNPRLKPYGFIGIGAFHFNPEGSYTDANGVKTWYKLHPLKTEGQGMPQYPDRKEYKLTQMNIPVGGGIKFEFTERLFTAAELLYRKTFTDYIDDVSRTYIDPNDFYLNLSPADAANAAKVSDKTHGIVTPGVNRYPPGTQRGNYHQDDAYFSFVLKVGIKLGYLTESARNVASQRRCPHLF